MGAGEMAQWLWARTALLEVLSSILATTWGGSQPSVMGSNAYSSGVCLKTATVY